MVQTKSLTSSGVVSTIAGSLEAMSNFTKEFGIAATTAKLGVTQGVAIDAAGNLFISTSDDLILKIATSTGIITAVAGDVGVSGYNGDGRLATSAALSYPNGVALDKFGNIFVADTSNHRIRKITVKTGIITTAAGSGDHIADNFDPIDNVAASNSPLNNPLDVAVDTLGNIYISDTSYSRVRKVTASTGIITTIAGNGNLYGVPILPALGVAATASGFFTPMGLTIDPSGNILFTDSFSNSIYKVTTSTGLLSLVAGTNSLNYGDSGDDIPATSALLNYPRFITTDAQGNIFFSNTGSRRICKITASTGVITTVVGDGIRSCSSWNITASASPSASLCFPQGVAVDIAGSIYFNDGHGVRKVTYSEVTPSSAVTLAPSMVPVSSITVPPTAATSLPTPTLRPSASLGIIITVAGTKPDTTGPPISEYGIAATSVRLGSTDGIAVDAAGNFFISTSNEKTILKVTARTGNITVIAGSGGGGSSGDGGLAISATLDAPHGIALDQFGNVFIATADSIRKITVSTGIITTVLSQKYSKDVALDTVGNIYIVNRDNYLVTKFTASTGVVTTIAGGGALLPSTEQGVIATATKLTFPSGVAVDTLGNVYITDAQVNSIYKVTASTGLLTVVAGKNTWNVGYNGDNILATTAYLRRPTFITIDAQGNIFFTDFTNYRIRKITASTGIITTVAGRSLIRYPQCQPNDYDSDGKDALSASLCYPRGVAVDTAGSVYFCVGNNVRKVTYSEITPSSAVTRAPSMAPVSSITVSPTAGTTTPSASMFSAPASTPSGVSPTAGATAPSASMPSTTVTSSTTALHITKKMHSPLILLSSLLIFYLY